MNVERDGVTSHIYIYSMSDAGGIDELDSQRDEGVGNEHHMVADASRARYAKLDPTRVPKFSGKTALKTVRITSSC